MTGEYYTYRPATGSTQIVDPRLWGRRILLIEREGEEVDVVYNSAQAGNRKAQHIAVGGRLKFDTPFSDGERVYVLIKR